MAIGYARSYRKIMAFKITPLKRSEFEHLFEMSDDELAAAQAMRVNVDKKPGFPCRVSLQDADIGEEVILVHYEHLPVDTPFRASHAVYVRPNATPPSLSVNEIPEALRRRVLSLRGFSEAGMLVTAELADGEVLGTAIEKMLEDRRVALVHIHFAKPGCYAARADRV